MTRNPHAAQPAPHNPWREICAASIGNALEFYDLLIYGYFAIVIGQLFFPTHDAATSLLLSVGTFGISFVTRPLGSIVLGSYADRAGRKASLTISIGLMMLGTAMIAFAPTYAQIGIASPLLIIVARMLQGFSTGGEFGAATAFMVEQADAKRRGFFASWQMSTQGLATVLAAGVSALLSLLLTADQLHAWGWRVAFAVGLLIGPVGLYIRRNIDEPADFRRLGEAGRAKSPLRDVFVRDRANMLLGAGVVATATAFNYVHKLYMPTYAVKQLHIPATSSYLGAVVTGAMLMIAAPVVGHLSDRFGRIRVMLIALILVGVTTWPLFVLLNRSSDGRNAARGAGAGRAADRGEPGAAAGAARGHLPDQYARHGPRAVVQLLGDAVRRLRAADRDLADRRDARQAGAEFLRDGDGRARHHVGDLARPPDARRGGRFRGGDARDRGVIRHARTRFRRSRPTPVAPFPNPDESFRHFRHDHA
ncbi:Citrate-proton symporter [Burkholderia cenocepacia H111]|nr:Citrate-proton symporter [Burkholderia cenocepacia H111]